MSRIVKEQTSSDFTNLLLAVPTGSRPFVIVATFSPAPPAYLDKAFDLAATRIAPAELWEDAFGSPMPIAQCQQLLGDPASVTAWIELGRFIILRTDWCGVNSG